MLIELILIRHGETIFNREERMQGSLDSPLTERGAAEAVQLGRALAASDLLRPTTAAGETPTHTRWLVSPQGRARETSRLIRQELARAHAHLPPEEVHDLLREIHCGHWEGLTRADIGHEAVHRIHASIDEAYPGGESRVDVSRRGTQFLEWWRETMGDWLNTARRAEPGAPAHHRTVIVSHGNFLCCLGGVLVGLGPAFAVRAIKGNTAVSRFFAREADLHFRLHTWNDRSHLSGGQPLTPIQ